MHRVPSGLARFSMVWHESVGFMHVAASQAAVHSVGGLSDLLNWVSGCTRCTCHCPNAAGDAVRYYGTTILQCGDPIIKIVEF